jgi:hypothetical protein
MGQILLEACMHAGHRLKPELQRSRNGRPIVAAERACTADFLGDSQLRPGTIHIENLRLDSRVLDGLKKISAPAASFFVRSPANSRVAALPSEPHNRFNRQPRGKIARSQRLSAAQFHGRENIADWSRILHRDEAAAG